MRNGCGLLPGCLAPANLPPTMRIYTLERSLSREEKESEAEGLESALVGRDAEKAELFAAFHSAVNAPGGGRLGTRVVLGELGIGKSALVAAFTHDLPPNARVVRVECSPVRMEVPYASIAELVLWIGYLQWHFKIHGQRTPSEPILRAFKNIENRDAVLAYDGEPVPVTVQRSATGLGVKTTFPKAEGASRPASVLTPLPMVY